MYDKNTSEMEIGVSEGFIFQSFPRFINALSKGMKCSFCKTKLSEKNIGMFNSEHGIRTEKYNPTKKWVYVTCSKCGYQWSWIRILRRFYK